MVEIPITLRTPYNLRGLQLVDEGDNRKKALLISPRAHALRYATATFEGGPLALSSNASALCAVGLPEHAARHFVAIDYMEPKLLIGSSAATKDGAVSVDMSAAWDIKMPMAEAYRLSRESLDDFPISFDIVDGDHLTKLTLRAYMDGCLRVIEANLANKDLMRAVIPNYLSPLIFRGDRHIDLSPGGVGVASLDHAWEFFVLGYQWPREYMGSGVFTKGARVFIDPRVIIPYENVIQGAIKLAGNYGSIRTRLKDMAKALGLNDVIILGRNKEGATVVTEMSGADVFIVKDRVLITQPPSRLILEGITRDLAVLELAERLKKELGLKGIEQRDFSLEEFLNADEVFATGSAAKVTPIVEINIYNPEKQMLEPHKIRNGEPGVVTKALQAIYFFLERGEPFVHDNSNGVWQEPVIVSDFVSRATRVPIPPKMQEIAARQLGLIEEQTFDRRFRAPRTTEIRHAERAQRRVAGLR